MSLKPGPQRRHLLRVKTRSLSPGEPPRTRDRQRASEPHASLNLGKDRHRREGGRWERMDKASWKWGKLPPLLLHTLCHPSCLALALYSSFCPRVYYIFSCALSRSPLAIHSHHSPSLLSFALPFSFFSLHLKRMHYFQPWLCGVDGERERAEQWPPFSFTTQHWRWKGGGGGGVFGC